MCEIIVFTSGKGGVGKTTAVAGIGTELSLLDKKVVMMDADMGLRNLDVVMGLENRITYNLADVLLNRCRVGQALVRDRRYPNLYMIPAALNYERLSDKTEEFFALLNELRADFDYCLIDCPAGIEDGFRFAVSHADRAVVVTTPHISAVRDAERVVRLLSENCFMKRSLMINQVSHRLIRRHNVLSISDIEFILGQKALGWVDLDDRVIISQNQGIPVTAIRSVAGRQFKVLARKLMAEGREPADLAVEESGQARIGCLSEERTWGYEVS